jgi:hypothetical protein
VSSIVRRRFKSIGIVLGLRLCLAPTQAHAYDVTLFPATKVFDQEPRILHQKLGLEDAGLIVEGFEGENLIEGLNVTLVRRDDTPLNVWDGSKAVEFEDKAEFKISLPNVRLFGIGVGDNDGGTEQISINNGPPIALSSLPNFLSDGQKRAYYLLIEAAPGEEYIRSVVISNAFTIICDHLVLKQDNLDPNRPLQLVLDLVDGSRVIGVSAGKSVTVKFFGVDAEIPYASILSVELNSSSKNATIALRNGDRFRADVLANSWRVATSFGEQSIPVELIRKIAVQTRR